MLPSAFSRQKTPFSTFRRHGWKALVVIGLALTVGLSQSSTASARFTAQQHHVHPTIRLTAALQARLQDGDLVFRRSPDLTSWVIRAQSQHARFTHVGMIVRHGDELFVLHALPTEVTHARGGVRLERLSEFHAKRNAEDLALFGVRGLSPADRATVRRYALAQLGKPFDSAFRYGEDDNMYCTEIVLKALAQVGIRADRLVPRVTVLLHDEGIAAPDDLRRWDGLVSLATASVTTAGAPGAPVGGPPPAG